MKAARYYDLKTMRFVVTKLKQEKVKPNNKFFKHWQIFQERVEAQRKKSVNIILRVFIFLFIIIFLVLGH